MPAPLALPRIAWGHPSASRRALLVHGLGSSAALMWRIGEAMAEAGWLASAVDLRGHGDAPRALDYTVAAYAADVAATLPDDDGAWDAVIGHSLGGSASIVASASDPDWARRLVLIDPAIHVSDRDAEIIRQSQVHAFADPTLEAIQRAFPTWHPQDQELKLEAVRRASAWAVEQTSAQNQPWDVRAEAARLTVPTHILGADPAIHSLFTGDLATAVLSSNPRITMSVVAGAGHSLHRDKPEESLRQLFAALG